MRRLSLLPAALFVVSLFGSDSPKEYDDKTEIVGIEGTWRLIEMGVQRGRRAKYEALIVMKFRSGTIRDDIGDGLDCARNLPHRPDL